MQKEALMPTRIVKAYVRLHRCAFLHNPSLVILITTDLKEALDKEVDLWTHNMVARAV